MSRRSALSRSRSVLALTALSLLMIAGCGGGTPLRFALSSITGAAFSPRRDDGGRPVPNAEVRLFRIASNAALSPIELSGALRTDAAGLFVVRDILPGQTVLIQVTGTVPAAQQAAGTPVTVSAIVPIPPPPAPDQPPPAVSARVDLISDLAAGAALQLIQQGALQPEQISASIVQTLENIARQVATNNCLLPGQDCSGGGGSPAEPSREELINAVVAQAVQTPGVVTPPDTGGVGVILR